MRHFWASKFAGVGSKPPGTPSGGPAHIADNSPAPETAGRSRPVRLIILCGVLLIVAIAVGTGIMLSNLRNRALTDNERELRNTAFVLAEQMERDFAAVESVQTSLIERFWASGIASSEDYERIMSGHDAHLVLKDKVVGFNNLGALILVNAQGKVFNFSRSWPIPDINVADRNYFTALQSDEKLNSVVSKPIRSRATGAWIVQIARKVSGPNGEFLGLVLGTIELQGIEQFFARVSLGPDSSISLLHRDGELMARHPHVESLIGRPIPGGLAVKLVSNSEHGVGRRIGAVGNAEDRLIAAHRVARYPFLIAATTNTAAVLADWWRTAIYLIGIAALAILVVAAGTLLVIRQLKNHASLERARVEKIEADKLREQAVRLDVALSNMSQGLVMFDSARRLVICNDRYRQIFKLPPDLAKPGYTVLDLLKYRIANGTFSGNPEKYVDDLMATIAHGKMASQQVETGDGRIISVMNQPMVGGGWVATHEDVTERKKTEDAIEENRNNLERAEMMARLGHYKFEQGATAVTWSEGLYRIVGQSPESFTPTLNSVLELVHSDDRPALEQYRRDAMAGLDLLPVTLRLVKEDGQLIYVENWARPLRASDDSVIGMFGTLQDVTERKRAEDDLRRTQKFLDAVIENVPAPIAVKDVPSSAKDARDCRFTLLNRAGEELLGVPRQQIIGKTAVELYPTETADLIIAHDSKALWSEQMILTSDYPFITPRNGTRLVMARKIAIRGDDGKPQHLLAVLEDVTERRKSEQRIVHMAHYDTLTDLPNRATFKDTLDATLDRAATAGERFGILSIDLDHFKEANDTYGHLVGDALLREVARRLQAATGGAFLARLGGDEFALIVTDGAQPAATAALGERLLAAIVDDFEVEGHRLKFGMSIGGAIYPTDGTDAKTLMTNADAALYRAKAGFRGTALFFESEMSARLHERYALQEDLRLAIDRGELLLHYQPQVTMSGDAIGFEALARWQCPKRGMVPPGTFIPIAEESSLIISLGEWVLREACREAASWPQPLTIAVNISPIQFRHGDLPRLVHSILLETGLAPGRLELEITEGVMINDFSRAVSILNQLKSLGVKIAMDDFGTGYSSLSYLQSFRCDKIKIDRVFICDLEDNYHSRSIVRAVISLGRSLNLPILAEGVETEAQHTFLKQEGCDEVQGYLTGRPLPIADYAKLIGRQAIAQQNYAMAG